MQKVTLNFSGAPIQATIQLVGSKSESNRALILKAVADADIDIENLSSADDTVILQRLLDLLNQPTSAYPIQLNVGPAGTTMRFLTALLAFSKGTYELTGSHRMTERPIKILVDALRELGANIQYTGKEGYPPLLIDGNTLQNNPKVAVSGTISSQYISALLLIAPKLPMGLQLNIVGKLTSKPYVEMTLNMLQSCGIEYTWQAHQIEIRPQKFKASTLKIEPDWSAASYWYSIVALAPQAEVFLPGLKKDSLQGDQQIVHFMDQLGVHTDFLADGIRISKKQFTAKTLFFEMINCPDLAQTVIVCCGILGIDAVLMGLETLKIKETNRVLALQKELAKINVLLEEQNGIYNLNAKGVRFPHTLSISTYEDHRMAMAFAPLALRVNTLVFDDMEVVNKSYPTFWNNLNQVGITTEH